ncbi:MAG: hypothetical protein KKF56_03085 [Nanoarchaeota archaeon]|nr:hypothetical protein [Nanoarchaeota archaeon]
MTKIAVDADSGDGDKTKYGEGARIFLQDPANQNHQVILFGNKKYLQKYEEQGKIQVVHSPRHPIRDAVKSVNQLEADVLVGLGDTKRTIVTAWNRLGLIKHLQAPFLATPLPGGNVISDVGAALDPSRELAYQMAIGAYVLATEFYGIKHPLITTVSTGEEPEKGDEFVKSLKLEQMLPDFEIAPFQLEGRDLVPNPKTRRIKRPCIGLVNGYAGNIALKIIEETGPLIIANWYPEFEMLDALPLIGLENGEVMIGHGNSDPQRIAGAYRNAAQYVPYKDRVRERLKEKIRRFPDADNNIGDSRLKRIIKQGIKKLALAVYE